MAATQRVIGYSSCQLPTGSRTLQKKILFQKHLQSKLTSKCCCCCGSVIREYLVGWVSWQKMWLFIEYFKGDRWSSNGHHAKSPVEQLKVREYTIGNERKKGQLFSQRQFEEYFFTDCTRLTVSAFESLLERYYNTPCGSLFSAALLGAFSVNVLFKKGRKKIKHENTHTHYSPAQALLYCQQTRECV